MKKRRKNPHAVALGRLGGLVRSEAKQRANRKNGRKGGLVKSRKKRIPPAATRGVRVPVAARNHRNRDRQDPRALRTASNRPRRWGNSKFRTQPLVAGADRCRIFRQGDR